MGILLFSLVLVGLTMYLVVSKRLSRLPWLNPGEWLMWALMPWPAVAAGLYYFHSAFLAFAFYATVCLLGAWRLGGLSVPVRFRLSWKVHVVVALCANLLLVGLYAILKNWVMPVERMQEALASVGITRQSFWWVFPYFLIGNPYVEETFWRAGIPKHDYGGFPFGSLVASILFGAWHSLAVFLFMPPWSAALATIGIIVIGIALAEIDSGVFRQKRKERYLGDAILFHALAADLPLLIILAIWL